MFLAASLSGVLVTSNYTLHTAVIAGGMTPHIGFTTNSFGAVVLTLKAIVLLWIFVISINDLAASPNFYLVKSN